MFYKALLVSDRAVYVHRLWDWQYTKLFKLIRIAMVMEGWPMCFYDLHVHKSDSGQCDFD